MPNSYATTGSAATTPFLSSASILESPYDVLVASRNKSIYGHPVTKQSPTAQQLTSAVTLSKPKRTAASTLPDPRSSKPARPASSQDQASLSRSVTSHTAKAQVQRDSSCGHDHDHDHGNPATAVGMVDTAMTDTPLLPTEADATGDDEQDLYAIEYGVVEAAIAAGFIDRVCWSPDGQLLLPTGYYSTHMTVCVPATGSTCHPLSFMFKSLLFRMAVEEIAILILRGLDPRVVPWTGRTDVDRHALELFSSDECVKLPLGAPDGHHGPLDVGV
jgi:hypothetical protein